jgi:exodeoxyribonuclease VII small subunit
MTAPENSTETTPNLSFEKALETLQQTVKKLESGELSLELALKSFEEGVRLARQCQDYLQKAEKRVELLTRADPDPKLEPFTKE